MLCVVVLVVETRSTQGLDENDESMLGGEWAFLFNHNGKLVYTLRQFPLNAPAMTGAMLVQCVGQQSDEQYYTFTHVLFDAQDKWAFDANYLTSLQTIAAVGGIDAVQFQACLNKDRETELLKQKKLANDELKVPHTPYFYIGGYAYEGPKNFEEVSKFIDAQLARK